MSDFSSCTRPPCLAKVADILKTYKKLVAASTYQIRLLPLPYTLWWHPLRWFKPVWSPKGMLITKFICKNPSAVYIVTFDFADGAYKYPGGPFRFHITGSKNQSRRSLSTPDLCNIMSWWPFSSIWQYVNPIACCSILLLLLVLRTIVGRASCKITTVPAIALSRWTE